MPEISRTLAEVLADNVQQLTARVQVLASDRETVIQERLGRLARVEFQGARTTADGRSVRRSCVLEIDNPAGELTPDLYSTDSALGWARWLRPQIGYYGAAGLEWIDLGIMSVDTAHPLREPNRTGLRVTARDGAAHLMRRFGQVLTFEPSGSVSVDYAKEVGASATASSGLPAGTPLQGRATMSLRACRTRAGVREEIPVVAGSVSPNLLTANQSSFETGLTGWITNYGSTITRDTTTAWHGQASMRVTTLGINGPEGARTQFMAAKAGQQLQGSVYARGSGKVLVFVRAYNAAGTALADSGYRAYTLSGSWTRLTANAFTCPADTAWVRLLVLNDGAQAAAYWLDGAQLEFGTAATAWVLGQEPLPSDPRAMVDGSTSTYASFYTTDPQLQSLEITVQLELPRNQTLESVTPRPRAGTTCMSLRSTTDGITWTTHPASGVSGITARVIEATFTTSAKAHGELTIAEVQVNQLEILAGAGSNPGDAIDSSRDTGWEPEPHDRDRWLRVTFAGSRTFNQVLISVGETDGDQWNRVRVRLDCLESGDWVTRHTTAHRVAGRWEIVLSSVVTATAIRLTALEVVGRYRVRDVEVRHVTQTNTISFLIGQIAQHCGETRTRITPTLQVYPYVIGWAEKDECWSAIQKLAASIGWEAGYSVDGYLEVGPPVTDPTNPVWEFIAGESPLTLVQAEPDSRSIVNHWRVVGAGSNYRPVSGEAKDDSISSPTGIPAIGTRYDERFDSLCDTTAKCEARARQLLAESTRITVPVRLAGLAVPHIEEGQVVRVREPQSRVDGSYQVDSWHLTIEPGRAHMEWQLAHIPR